MLILTRKKNESIKINDNIEVSVLEVENGVVKIGISAPRSVRILRSELTKSLPMLNEQATHENKGLLKKVFEALVKNSKE